MEVFELTPLLPSQALSIEIDKLINRIRVLQRRVIMLMSATAKVRYQSFLDDYPDIVQRVPQKMIASYLGITPEALSRLRIPPSDTTPLK